MAFTEAQQPTKRRGRAKDVTKREVQAAREFLRQGAYHKAISGKYGLQTRGI
nr:hypothetical protein [[Pseudomonas] sp. BICA1-14]